MIPTDSLDKFLDFFGKAGGPHDPKIDDAVSAILASGIILLRDLFFFDYLRDYSAEYINPRRRSKIF